MYVREGLGERFLFWGHPARDRTHWAERAPSTWRIDETQNNTHNCGYYNNRPEHSTDTCPHGETSFAPRHETKLEAKHAKDEENHEQSETEGAHKLGNRTVGGVFGQ